MKSQIDVQKHAKDILESIKREVGVLKKDASGKTYFEVPEKNIRYPLMLTIDGQEYPATVMTFSDPSNATLGYEVIFVLGHRVACFTLREEPDETGKPTVTVTKCQGRQRDFKDIADASLPPYLKTSAEEILNDLTSGSAKNFYRQQKKFFLYLALRDPNLTEKQLNTILVKFSDLLPLNAFQVMYRNNKDPQKLAKYFIKTELELRRMEPKDWYDHKSSPSRVSFFENLQELSDRTFNINIFKSLEFFGDKIDFLKAMQGSKDHLYFLMLASRDSDPQVSKFSKDQIESLKS